MFVRLAPEVAALSSSTALPIWDAGLLQPRDAEG